MSEARITVGQIVGVFGVRGWVKVYSYTRPREAILNYSPWLIVLPDDWRAFDLAEGRAQGKGIIARLDGHVDRDQASALMGVQIAINQSQLSPLKPGEYYWAQLEGLKVVDTRGRDLGTIHHLFETGANDVLVVHSEAMDGSTREQLIPFVPQVIRQVDLDAALIRVEWDAQD